MRSNYSIKNSFSSFLCNIVMLIINFIAKTIFLKILSIEYFGLNGLFDNILTMLNFFELGIGSAIVFNLYEPIHNNNIPVIKSLVDFYKKAYRIISFVILVLGICLIPFLKIIVGEISVNINLSIIYILFLSNVLLTYSIAHKKSFIIANQRNYVINIIHTSYYFVLNSFQLIYLYYFRDYYGFLIIKIIFQIFENITISLKVNHDYPFLCSTSSYTIDNKIKGDIFNKVKALINHKFATIIVFGTDNIIISLFFGIIPVGLYANYSFIFNTVTVLFSGIISSTSASVGNLLAEKDKKKNLDTFKKINFLNYWIAVFTSICLLFLIQPFIQLWLGKDFLLGFSVLFVLVLNYFQSMMRYSYSTFKDSAGIWVEDKYVPIVEAISNIVFSIILLKIFGLVGVFLGTLVSCLCLWLYSYPKFVYKKIFNDKYLNYFKNIFIHLIIFSSIILIVYLLSNIIIFNSIIFKFSYNLLLCLLIPNLVLFIIYCRSNYFKYFYKKILKR